MIAMTPGHGTPLERPAAASPNYGGSDFRQ
jgi:hypothetical protein